MPATLTHEDGGPYRLEISGTLDRADLEMSERELAAEIDKHGAVRLLVVARNFSGWASGSSWNDLDFYQTHGTAIARIAIVADFRWREPLLLFANAELRRAPVQYFVPGSIAQARAWVMQ